MLKILGTVLISLAAGSVMAKSIEGIQRIDVVGGQLESSLCKAALESVSDMQTLAQQALGRPLESTELLCDGLPVKAWLTKMQVEQKALTTYITASASDASTETRLCLASLESEDKYRSAKQELSASEWNIESELVCNGEPFNRFVARYRPLVDEVTLE